MANMASVNLGAIGTSNPAAGLTFTSIPNGMDNMLGVEFEFNGEKFKLVKASAALVAGDTLTFDQVSTGSVSNAITGAGTDGICLADTASGSYHFMGTNGTFGVLTDDNVAAAPVAVYGGNGNGVQVAASADFTTPYLGDALATASATELVSTRVKIPEYNV